MNNMERFKMFNKKELTYIVDTICNFIKKNLTYTEDRAYMHGDYEIDFTVHGIFPNDTIEDYYIVIKPTIDLDYERTPEGSYVLKGYSFEIGENDLDADIDNYIQIFDITGLDDISFLDENDLAAICVSCNMTEDDLLCVVEDIVIEMSYNMWKRIATITL